MRLIDAYAVRCDRDEFDTYADYIKAFDAINEAPTVDAVPVIRCKDCKWYEFDEPHRCGFGGHGLRGKSDYCSDAERKEE